MTPAGFPHSDTPGSTLGCQLPRAYRRLLRPSSALDAKASTMCPSQLVTHTTNPTPAHTTPDPPRNNPERPKPHRSTSDWRCTQHATKEPHTPTTITAEVCIKQKETHQQPTPTNQATAKPSQLDRHGSTSTGQAGASPDARVHYPDLKQQ